LQALTGNKREIRKFVLEFLGNKNTKQHLQVHASFVSAVIAKRFGGKQ
jgi:hypothetical protein